MTEKFSNVVNPVVDHGRALKRETPGDYADILRQTHGTEHLWTEDTRVTDFNPALELGVETEDLERGLGIGVICWLELQLLDTNL